MAAQEQVLFHAVNAGTRHWLDLPLLDPDPELRRANAQECCRFGRGKAIIRDEQSHFLASKQVTVALGPPPAQQQGAVARSLPISGPPVPRYRG